MERKKSFSNIFSLSLRVYLDSNTRKKYKESYFWYFHKDELNNFELFSFRKLSDGKLY